MQSLQRIKLTTWQKEGAGTVARGPSMVTIGHDCWARGGDRGGSAGGEGGAAAPGAGEAGSSPVRGPFKSAEELGFWAAALVGEAKTLGVLLCHLLCNLSKILLLHEPQFSHL